MRYEYINSESYEEVQDISIFIFEYFNNDYLVIRDFLVKTPSPWDNIFLMEINNGGINLVPSYIRQDKDSINEIDLRNIKARVISEIINNYTMCITIPFLEEYNCLEDDVRIASLDGTIIDKFRNSNNNPELLLFDDYYMIRVMEFYVKTLLIKTDYNLRLNTYNKFKYDVLNVDRIFSTQAEKIHYNDLVLQYAETESEEYEKQIQKFDLNVARSVRNYINLNFREQEDVFEFINYLFSLVYAYIIFQKERGEEIECIEESIVNAVEGDTNLTQLFFNNVAFASQIVEEIHDNIAELGKDYDLRHSIKNKEQQEILSDLDNYYDNTDINNIMIHTYALDSKLHTLLFSLLLKNGSSKLYEILMDTTSIQDNLYVYLLDLGLDARNSNFYKKLMIKKIVTDVFEYLNNDRKKDIDVFNYNLIKNIDSYEKLINYFSNNYNYLIDKYIEYLNKGLYEHEKSRFNIIKNGNIHHLEKIYFYSIDRYLDILSSNYTELKYIDDLDLIIDKINSSHLMDISDINKILIYVYERLISEPEIIHLSPYLKEKILFYIESREDYSYIEDNEIFQTILNCFCIAVTASFSYEDECFVRKKIKDENKIKILEKMKKYEQID